MSEGNTLELFSKKSRPRIQEVNLQEETEKRYLNYALSVITSRALPDVRDGLKPVQRRILYAMYHNLKLLPTSKYRKSAAVVGEVMGKYHPHGDQSIYDATVRMAQPFSLRHPLVEGYGNFGSIDGDKAAAMRYTEVRLQPISIELLDELSQNTVNFQDNFDGSQQEPIVLPARFPQLLVNGSSGIAVGMATNIPPHNLGEVMDALLLLLDDPNVSIPQLMRKIKAPDFPTGGQIITPRQERLEIYEKGQGNLLIRAEWKLEEFKTSARARKKSQQIVITSIPYTVNKASLVEKIAEVIIDKKLPMLLDVRDESTEKIRIVLELKSGADPELVMAYLYKHTPLEHRFTVNLTCLIPRKGENVSTPARLSLKEMLEHFRDFRLETMRRRFQHERDKMSRKLHILEGKRIIFSDLDKALQLIRESDGRKDSAIRLQYHFQLDEVQTEAILEIKIHQLARLEIKTINEEAAYLRRKLAQIDYILSSPQLLQMEMKKECLALKEAYSEPRRTKIKERTPSIQFDPDALIQEENTHIILTQKGWIKRIKNINNLENIRTREDDAVRLILFGHTKESVCFVTNMGMAYTIRIWDIPTSTGYGVPLQSLFKFQDGEKVLNAFKLPPQPPSELPFQKPEIDSLLLETSSSPQEPHFLIITRQGYGSKLPLSAYIEVSTKTGRRIVRRAKGDTVLAVFIVFDDELLTIATAKRRYLHLSAEQIKALSSPGKGVKLIQLDEDDELIGAMVHLKEKDVLRIENEHGKEIVLAPTSRKDLGRRNSRGQFKRQPKGRWVKMLLAEASFPAESPSAFKTSSSVPTSIEPTIIENSSSSLEQATSRSQEGEFSEYSANHSTEE